jgi:hypothetical protein
MVVDALVESDTKFLWAPQEIRESALKWLSIDLI